MVTFHMAPCTPNLRLTHLLDGQLLDSFIEGSDMTLYMGEFCSSSLFRNPHSAWVPCHGLYLHSPFQCISNGGNILLHEWYFSQWQQSLDVPLSLV